MTSGILTTDLVPPLKAFAGAFKLHYTTRFSYNMETACLHVSIEKEALLPLREI
jgi:hypothetical protein